ncbi:B-cadherin [Hemibagrus wyckioides]|uniref:B-cadherin n=1 Tax=Hemibagrus wyckioides TaxID=337641 RepID=UPI00266C4863|nr:B-cadherin [Hemibagrus wyckioides]
MELKWDIRLGVLIVLLQVVCGGSVLSTPCSPGFESDLFVLTVHRHHLHRGTRLGTVVFNNCDGRMRTVFDTTDRRFHVESDGTVKMKRQVTLHDGHKTFSVHAWDSKGKKHTALVRVEHQGKANHNHEQQEDVGASELEQTESILLLEFPKSGGLRRRKREWVIPPIRILENDRKGPFPKPLVQIKSSFAKETQMVYRITGVGADQPPVGLFTIDKFTGQMYVSRPLDREEKDKYELQAHAQSATDTIKEPAMEVIVEVLDANDNHPIFTQNPFLGSVPEASNIGFEFMTVSATDADDPNTDNAEIRYSITSQIPPVPYPNMFEINPVTGAIRVNSDGLDRETVGEYTLDIQAADMAGQGRGIMGKAVITVTDSNDNAPVFSKTLYEVSVPEDNVGALVAKLPVTDDDEPQSSAWAAKFRIVNGNSGGFFNISTAPNKQEGIITTVKGLDYEENNKFTLLVVVENEVPFAKPLPTSTATVIVNVLDVNEAPVFEPKEKIVFKAENAAVDSELAVYTATDPDTNRNQKITYRIGTDLAGWLKVNPETGLITVKSPMDRESTYVKDGKYKALILAVDDDVLPATGTGTLVIELEDVNDNAPLVEERDLRICNKDSPPSILSVTDADGPGNTSPFSVELQGDGRNNWTARMNDSKTGIILSLKTPLQQGIYSVILRVFDAQQLSQENVVQVEVCDCTGSDVQCKDLRGAVIGFPAVFGILGAVLALLLLLLLLLLFLKRKGTKKEQPLINDDDIRDNVYYYDEEGGGEDDQDYDLSVLHRGLDNRPDVFRNDVAPTFMPAPQYRPRPANPEEIGTFIDDNLKAADNDPTAPPYDSLLVFDYEGGGSEAGSLSSLNSSSSGDQDYDRLGEWGPRFKKLADMYGGGED